MQLDNIVKADTYKFSHFKQYRPGTKYVSSYIESRGSDRGWKDMVFVGFQYLVEEYLSKPLVTEFSLNRKKRRAAQHGVSFNEAGFRYLLDNYKGFAPVRIEALPEGTVVPLKTPLVQVVNTDPNAHWVTSFIETSLLRGIWYPSTVATLSFQIKRNIREHMLATAGHTDGIDFMLHDFGPRGVSSSESAQIGGFGHLCNFLGSDNDEALEMIDIVYGEEMAGFSVDAAEHSTITSFGGPKYELEAYAHQLEVLGQPGRIFSVVSDTYNIFEAVSTLFGKELHDKVVSLGEHGGRLVVRPDSGDPATVVCEIIDRLCAAFGFTTNQKGYKVLPPYIRVLQGDGVNDVSINQILWAMRMKGFSAENVVFGMGGALLQGVNRDTLKFAMKASAVQNGEGFKNNEWYDIKKMPITDQGKVSKAGRLAVIGDRFSGFQTIREEDLGDAQNQLVDHYINGQVLKTTTLAEIRNRMSTSL